MDDPDVEVVDQEHDWGAGVSSAESDVVEPAVVAQAELTAGERRYVPSFQRGVDEGAGLQVVPALVGSKLASTLAICEPVRPWIRRARVVRSMFAPELRAKRSRCVLCIAADAHV